MKKRLIAGLAIGITILGMSSANALVISSTDAWQYGYSGENGQWPCRESGRLYAVKTATIPVKTARV